MSKQHKIHDFPTVVDKAIASGKYKNRQAVANAMGMSKQKMSGYYNGINCPNLTSARKWFAAVGYDIQIIELTK